MWQKVERFIVYSETTVIKGGLHGKPSVKMIPSLKGGLEGFFKVESLPLGLDWGLENKNFTENAKSKIEELETTINHLKTLYF